MTIFIEIVRKLFPDLIRAIMEESIDADKSISNTVLSWMGYGRDTVLAKDKRLNVEDLLFKVIHFKPKEQSNEDKENYNVLKTLINDTIAFTKEKAKEKGYLLSSNTETKLGELKQLLKECYLKLESSHLLNVPYDDDPLTTFRFFMSVYFCQKIIGNYKASTFEAITQNPTVTNQAQLTVNKESKALEALTNVENVLKTLASDSENYSVARKSQVIEVLRNLQRINKKMCKTYGFEYSVPVSVTVFSMFAYNAKFPKPGQGYLDICISASIEEIEAKVPSASLAQLSPS